MPGLTRNPDDELIRRLVSLESRVQGLETQRSRPFVGGQARAASPQVYPTNTVVVVDLATAVYDSGGVVDLTANRLTAPVGGVYLVSLGNPDLFANTPGVVSLGYRINGVDDDYSVGASFVGECKLTWPQTYVVRLNAGDYVDCTLFAQSGTTYTTTLLPFRVTLDRLHD